MNRGRSRRTGTAKVAAVVATVTVLMAGCSSSGGGTKGGGQSAQAPTPSAVSNPSLTKKTIVVGSISSDTGVAGSGNAVSLTLKTWQNWINSNGGLNGHPVKVISKDDAGDPAKSITAVKGLITDDHVIALINYSNLGDSWGKFVADAKVPVIDESSTVGFHYAKDPNFFPVGTTVLSIVYGQVYAAKQSGAKSFGDFYCAEVAACAQSIPLVKGYSAQLGLKFAEGVSFSASAPDYAAPCLTMKNSGAEAVELAGSGVRLVDACAKQNFKPTWIVSSGSFTDQMRTDAAFDGTVGDTGTFPWFLDVPALKDFRTAMKSYLPDFKGIDNLAAMSTTWAAGAVLAKAAADVSDTPTSQDIYTGLYKFKNEALGGIVPPLTFVKDKPTVVPCFFLLGIKNKQFVSSTGLKTSCQDAKGAAGGS